MSYTLDSFNDPRHFLPGGKWSCAADDIVANFPACAILFHEDDVPDSLQQHWIDRVGGIDLEKSPAGGTEFVKEADGIHGTAVVPPTGTMPTVGDKHGVYLHMGVPASTPGNSNYFFGNDYNEGVRLTFGNAGYLAMDVSNYVQTGALSGAVTQAAGPYCLGLMHDRAGNDALKYCSSRDGTINETVGKDADNLGDTDGTWPQMDAQLAIEGGAGAGGTEMLVMFTFETPPVDMEAAVAWMAANRGKIYPGWAGKL